MEMIERVARAIYDKWREAEGAQTTYDEMVRLAAKDGYPNAKKYLCLARDEARAAIEAMREPTDEMVAAGNTNDPESYCSARLVWHDMINAALAASPKADPT